MRDLNLHKLGDSKVSTSGASREAIYPAMTGVEEKSKSIEHYDTAAKECLKSRMLLALIVKEYVVECRDLDPRVIADQCIEDNIEVGKQMVDRVEGPVRIAMQDSEDASVLEGLIRYDVCFNVRVRPGSEEAVAVIVNIEVQNDTKPGYPLIKRAIYYIGRLLSSQKGSVFTHSNYQKLNKVYSIWFMPVMNEQRTKVPISTEVIWYSLEPEVMRGPGRFVADVQDYDMVNIVMAYLGDDAADAESGTDLLQVILNRKITYTEKSKFLQDSILYGEPEIERSMKAMTTIESIIRDEGRVDMIMQLAKVGHLTFLEALRLFELSSDVTEACIQSAQSQNIPLDKKM